MQHKKKCGLALAIAAAITAPSAFATTGYFSHGYSMKEKGLAGTGVAFPQDALAAANNPAGMVMIGERMDLGAALFSPIREYDASGPASQACSPEGCTFSVGPQSIESEAELFLIPSFGINWMLDSERSVGVSIYANGGMNTRYEGGTATFFVPPPGPGTFVTAPGTFGGGLPGVPGGSTAGVDLAQLFFNLSYSQKLAPKASWGASLILAYQQFEARGLGALSGFSVAPTKVTDNGHDKSTGIGAKIGIMGEVTPGVSLGAQYQSKISMSEFDDYKGLFAEGGDFDIPSTATLGLAWTVTPTSILTAEAGRIWYTDVDSVSNRMLPALGACFAGLDQSSCLGGSNGPGFGWEDINIYRIGYQWQDGDWTWRVGYINNDQPIPNSEVLFNILAPGVMEQHFTFGFTRQMGKDSELTFAAMYAPEEEVKGRNPLDQAQTITLRMKQYEVGAAWGWKF